MRVDMRHVVRLFFLSIVTDFCGGNIGRIMKLEYSRRIRLQVLQKALGVLKTDINSQNYGSLKLGTQTGTKWGPRSIAKLVYNSNNYLVYGTYNYSYIMGFINHLITGGPHLVWYHFRSEVGQHLPAHQTPPSLPPWRLQFGEVGEPPGLADLHPLTAFRNVP